MLKSLNSCWVIRMNSLLNQVKSLIGIADADEGLNNRISQIIRMTESRLKQKLGNIEAVPPELEYIVVEVAVIRFNRIGAEGMAKKTIEGLTTEFKTNDFDAYQGDIDDYIGGEPDGGRPGVVMFF